MARIVRHCGFEECRPHWPRRRVPLRESRHACRATATLWSDDSRSPASVCCRRRRRARLGRACIVLAIPLRVLPAVDQTVVAAKRTMPNDLSRCPVEFGDDLAAAPSTPRTAATWHIRKPIVFREMIGHPGHERAEEHGQAQYSLGDALRQISGPFVEIVPHVHDPAGRLCDAFRRHGISGGGATVSVSRPADRHGWPVLDSHGTSRRPTRRFQGSESSDTRAPPAPPSGDRPQSPAAGIAGHQAPLTHHESLVHRGPGGIARRARASESNPRCGPGTLRSLERTTPAHDGPRDRAAELPGHSESHLGPGPVCAQVGRALMVACGSPSTRCQHSVAARCRPVRPRRRRAGSVPHGVDRQTAYRGVSPQMNVARRWPTVIYS